MMFELTTNKISADQLNFMECGSDFSMGAVVDFKGVVRNINFGLEVKSLEYEVYPEMCLKIGKSIMEEALQNFSILKCYCIHRYGHLELGDVAVLVSVSSVHRREAFRACEYIIDEVKKRVPIWKREHYVGREPAWVACHHCGGN